MKTLLLFFLVANSISTFSQLTINTVTQNNPSCSGLCDGNITVNLTGALGVPSYVWTNSLGVTIGGNSPTINALCAGTYTLNATTPGSGASTTIYTEDFDGAAAGWNLNVPVGLEGADPNFWVINDNESGVAPGGCGTAGNGDQTLHVTSVFFPAGGAAYDAGGLCGLLLFCPETHRRAISPTISTLTFSTITVAFDYITNGGNPSDIASLWGNDGSGFVQLSASFLPQVCGSGQGLWGIHSVALPASYNNNAAVQFAIQWDNNDDGVGTDPSVAINNFRVFTNVPSPGQTTTQNFTLTDPTPVTLSNLLTTNPSCGNNDGTIAFDANGGVGGFQFSINNGTTLQGGNSFINLAAGTYDLYIEDANGCSSAAQQVSISSANAPIIDLIVPTDSDCINPTGTITITASGGTAPYTYSINGGATQAGNLFSTLAAGIYSVEVFDFTGCSATGSTTINSPGGPIITSITLTQNHCAQADGGITVVANSPIGATLSFSIDNNITTNPTGVFSNLLDGAYTVLVSDVNGCQTSQNTLVSTASTPAITNVTVTPANCGASDGSIDIAATGLATLNYSIDNGITTQTTSNFSGLAAGPFTVLVEDGFGCQVTINTTVTANNGALLSAGLDQTACAGTTILLNATGAGIVGVIWDNGVTNNAPFPATTTTTYTATGTDINGCFSTDQVTITVTPSPVFNVNTDLTSGCAPLTVNFSANSAAGSTISWEFSNGQNFNSGNNHSVVFQIPGCYDLAVVVSQNGCSSVQNLPSIVCVNPDPIASFLVNPSNLSLENTLANFINTSSNATNYVWSFGDNGFSVLENPTHEFPSVAGFYTTTLVATNADGCTDTAQVNIQIREELIYYIPNSFTPDGDEFNEQFLPVFTSGFDPQDYNLLVYNRWGELIFETRNHLVGWDGTYKGNLVKDGIYTYLVEFKSSVNDGRFQVTGHVSMLK